jgi:hypothetical protein
MNDKKNDSAYRPSDFHGIKQKKALEEIIRENKERLKVYPTLIRRGTLKRAEANKRFKILRALAHILQICTDNGITLDELRILAKDHIGQNGKTQQLF